MKINLTAKVLPVRIFRPALHHLLVGQAVAVLQVVQTCNQSRRDGRAAILAKRFSPLPIRAFPVDQPGELDQLVTRINEVFQALTKQIAGG